MRRIKTLKPWGSPAGRCSLTCPDKMSCICRYMYIKEKENEVTSSEFIAHEYETLWVKHSVTAMSLSSPHCSAASQSCCTRCTDSSLIPVHAALSCSLHCSSERFVSATRSPLMLYERTCLLHSGFRLRDFVIKTAFYVRGEHSTAADQSRVKEPELLEG